jgi:hypothetical protein
VISAASSQVPSFQSRDNDEGQVAAGADESHVDYSTFKFATSNIFAGKTFI